MKFKINTIVVFCTGAFLFLPYFSAFVNAQNSFSVTPSKEVAPLLPDEPGSLPIILTWDYNVFVMGPDEIAQFVARAKKHDIQQINLRVNNKGVMNVRIKNGTVYTERLDAFGPDFDPLKVLVEEAHKQGIKAAVHFDLFESSYDQFFIDNPQFTPQERKDVIYNAFPSYAHQETRDYMLGRVKELAEYGIDQMYFCTKSSHTPRNMTEVPRNSYAAYNPPVIKKYEELYDVNILEVDPEREKVAQIHGEFIIEFLSEAKDLLHQHGVESIAGATLSGYLQPSGKNIFLDWRKMAEQQVADALVMTNTRGETFAWYQEGASQTFLEILEKVKRNDMDLYAYILSTVFWHVRDETSWSSLFQYIPDQMNFFYGLGADAILIHEVYREKIWEVLGDWKYHTQNYSAGSEIITPRVDQLSLEFPGQVPHGGFEEENSEWFWDAMPGWLSLHDWLPLRHNATGLSLESFQEVWTSDTGGNEYLKAEYDWKVMAESDYSGRSYSGRSSILMYAEPNAGIQTSRTVSWNAKSDISVVPEDSCEFSVWIHGEELSGIEEAGMHINVKDKHGHVIDELVKNQEVYGTFSWREMELPYVFPDEAHEVEVSLYMTVASTEDTHGRLWFDAFRVRSVNPVIDEALRIIEGDDAFEGDRYALLQVSRGVELVSQSFNLDLSKGNILELAMRTSRSEKMKVQVLLGEENISTFEISDKWSTYELSLTQTDETVSSITIRPLNSGDLYLDAIRVH